ncbi:phosphate ABC transporter permease subunit PstC [Rhizobium oryziradicis]|uniref:Phosphate transport system permease protein n=1 Tax=Rhizobium oryziradicis TaxID=1867956 RepID=A0A1Q8ZR56_9HYPH|nr:phosphate ABC transporter permease subunit PstC [Rhizobium oryziradicis]OLP44537.1 phosphate ABC transporter permease subunit PstC [Rhizobium oryziradicis]
MSIEGQSLGHDGGAGAKSQRIQDIIFIRVTWLCAMLVMVVLLGVFLSLFIDSMPTWREFGLSFIWNERWSPAKDIYGAAAPIFGTLITSVIALVIGVPISFGIAIFLNEICPVVLQRPIGVAIELLAGIPSIIYGLWGFFVLAPIMQTSVQPFLLDTLGHVPGLDILFSGAPYGIGMLTAGVVLAIMILPFITSITRDVFSTVPVLLRESAYGMGMTTWEVVFNIIIPYTRRGLIGGVMLGLGRALGETMAVTFVIGNSHRIAASLLAPATTISASIANEFSEATSDLYSSSLIALGLILFFITFGVLAIAKWLIGRSETY